MKRWISRIPTPLIRERAPGYIFVLLLAFAFAVGGTGLFLELTG